jgi:pimeloyl-ACP methyl ester carboxylesterase
VIALTVEGRRFEAAWWGGDVAAPVLVLLHEGLGCVAPWRDFPASLARATGWRVFAYSRLGYGASDGIARPRPLSYMHDEARDWLPRVLDAAGIGACVLVGHSDGASIAAIHAAEARDARLRGLVLIAPHFFVEDVSVESIAAIRGEYERGGLRTRLARYHADVDAAFYGWNDAWLDPRFRAWDVTALLPRIAVPVLGLQGADDAYGTAAQLEAASRLIAAPVRTRLIAGARHAPHLEAPEETMAEITRFVSSLPGPARHDGP